MNLELGTGDRKTNPTPDQISYALSTLTGELDSFVILSKDPMTYLQASGSPDSGFVVEYQVGSIEQHYRSTRVDLPLTAVDSIFRAYSNEDPNWRTLASFEKEDLAAIEASGTLPLLLSLIVVLILGGALYWWKNAA